MYGDDHYQRSILDIDVKLNTPHIIETTNFIQRRRRKQTGLSSYESDFERNSLLIRPSRISVDLEADIEAREIELYNFRAKCQNAITSPLLTQALVRKTETFLEGIPENEDGELTLIHQFRKHIRIIQILCTICRRWRRYDLTLLLKIGANRSSNKHQMIHRRTKDSIINLNFDSRNFLVFQSKVSEDVKDCLRKQPYRRDDVDERKISTVLRKYKVFQMFSEEKQTSVSRLVGYERYDPGRVICLQNRNSDRFYFVLSGLISKVRTLDLAEGVKKRYFNELHQGSSTDILETLKGKKRGFSLICKTDVEVFIIEREDLQAIFFNSEIKTSIKRLMKSLELFKTYPCDNLFKHKAISVQFYEKKAIIETNIAESANIYIIKSGSCKVYMKQADIFRLKCSPPSENDNRRFSENTKKYHELQRALQLLPRLSSKHEPEEKYVHINTIAKGEIYGIESLLPRVKSIVHAVVSDNQFYKSPTMKNSETMLVSNGAECLLINKSKMLKYSDFCTVAKLMATQQTTLTLPNVEKLNDTLRWSLFKESIIRDIVSDDV